MPNAGVNLHRGNSETSEASAKDIGSSAAQHNMHVNSMSMKYVQFKPGQFVCLLDKGGKEIGKGKVIQAQGLWHGSCLEEVGTCVVEVTELKVERRTQVQHPSEVTGTTFEEAETKNGVMRVAWNANGMIMLPK